MKIIKTYCDCVVLYCISNVYRNNLKYVCIVLLQCLKISNSAFIKM